MVSIGKDWFYSGSIYQDFDPGSFKLRFATISGPDSDL